MRICVRECVCVCVVFVFFAFYNEVVFCLFFVELEVRFLGFQLLRSLCLDLYYRLIQTQLSRVMLQVDLGHKFKTT